MLFDLLFAEPSFHDGNGSAARAGTAAELMVAMKAITTWSRLNLRQLVIIPMALPLGLRQEHTSN